MALNIIFTDVEDGHWYNANKSPNAIVTDGEIYQVTMERSSFPVNNYTLGSELSEEGQYTLIVRARNLVENKEFQVGFYIDKTAPSITTNPAIEAGSLILGGFLLFVNASDIMDDGEISATITLDGAPFVSGSNVSSGSHVLNVEAVDRAGNTSTLTVSFTVIPYWIRRSKLITIPSAKRVVSAKIEIIANDLEKVNITDIQFQGGNILTGWVPHIADAVASAERVFVIGRDQIGQKFRIIGK